MTTRVRFFPCPAPSYSLSIPLFIPLVASFRRARATDRAPRGNRFRSSFACARNQTIRHPLRGSGARDRYRSKPCKKGGCRTRGFSARRRSTIRIIARIFEGIMYVAAGKNDARDIEVISRARKDASFFFYFF